MEKERYGKEMREIVDNRIINSNHRNRKKGFTHGGVFHADDVFATAFLMLLNPKIEITRGFQVPENFDGIVYDIGFGEFDHHQRNRKVRENGVPYAAFGLLWEAFGTEILEKEDAEKFDREFIQPLDYSDNTGEANTLALIIADFNPTWKKKETNVNASFWQAVDMAKQILDNRFSQILADREADKIVRKEMEKADGKILILKQALPWKKAVLGSDIIYIIYPSPRGCYNIQAVPEEEGDLVKAFSEKWRGKTAAELEKITGVKGFQFCHMSGFLCAADTLEAAIKIAELALKEE